MTAPCSSLIVPLKVAVALWPKAGGSRQQAVSSKQQVKGRRQEIVSGSCFSNGVRLDMTISSFGYIRYSTIGHTSAITKRGRRWRSSLARRRLLLNPGGQALSAEERLPEWWRFDRR